MSFLCYRGSVGKRRDGEIMHTKISLEIHRYFSYLSLGLVRRGSEIIEGTSPEFP